MGQFLYPAVGKRYDSCKEKGLAAMVKSMSEVVCYVKNQNLGFKIPDTLDGQQSNFFPDFMVVLKDRDDPEDLLPLIIEVTGEKKRDKESKVQTARTLWVPAVNNHGGLGRWDFLEVSDPWNIHS